MSDYKAGADDETLVQRPRRQIDTKQFNRYQLREILGKGGMGEVYKAWDPQLKRMVALKILRRHKFKDPSHCKRFIVEIRATAQLHHPNIVRLYEVGNEQGIPYYTMNYIQGYSLSKFVKEGGANPQFVAPLLQKVAEALHYAHERGIIHRDLKPGNIMIDSKGNPYVVDFGLAKIECVDYKITESGMVVGTPHYMSPEQAEARKDLIDRRSDVYSLGVILYELLTGKTPFKSKKMADMLRQIAKDTPPTPRSIQPKIPRDLELICLMAIAKKREQRYTSAAELAEDLQRFCRKEAITAREPQTPRQRQRLFWSIGALIAIVLFSMIFCYRYFWQKQRNYSLFSNDLLARKHEEMLADPTAKNRYEYARLLSSQGNYNEAKRQLEEALVLRKSRKMENMIREELLVLLVEFREYQKAIYHYSRLRYKPSQRSLLAIGKAYYFLGEREKARAPFRRVVQNGEVFPRKLEAFYFKGLLEYENQQYSAAVDSLEEAQQGMLGREAQFSFAVTLSLYLGISYFHCERYSQAIECLTQAQQSLPDLVLVCEYLGKSYLRGENNEDRIAVEHARAAKIPFQQCVKLQPNNDIYHLHLARVLYVLQNYERAEQHLQRALKINPLNMDILELLVKVTNRQIFWHSSRYHHFFRLFQNLTAISSPDLFVEEFRQIERLYHSYYVQAQSLSNHQGTPQKFLQKLMENTSPEVHASAVQALLSLRYHAHIERELASFLQKPGLKAPVKNRLMQVRDAILAAKLREGKLSIYYRIARLHLHDDAQMIRELSISNNRSQLRDIVKDSGENIFLRYLAAKSLLQILDFESVEQGTNAQDEVQAAICTSALIEAGFPKRDRRVSEIYQKIFGKDKNAFSQLNQSQYIFLKSLIARNLRDAFVLSKRPFQQEDDRVRLHAAVNCLQLSSRGFIQKDFQQSARKILLEYTRHPRAEFRQYAHYHFWPSFGRKDRWGKFESEEYKQYMEYFTKGLRDPDRHLKIILLSFTSHISLEDCEEELSQIAAKSSDTTLRVLAMAALCIWKSDHPLVRRIAGDESERSLIRITAFLSPMSGLIIKMAANKGFDEAKELKKLLQSVPKYVKNTDYHFRCMVMSLSAIIGFSPLQYYASEQDPDIRASLLFISCTEPLPYLQFLLKQKSITHEQQLKIVESQLDDSYLNIRKAAHVAYVQLLNQREREAFIEKLLRSGDVSARQGTAIGVYNLVVSAVLKRMSNRDRIRGGTHEERYDLHIYTLRYHAQEQKWREVIVNYLSSALALQEQPLFYYERAILYNLEGRFAEAEKDLQRAVAMEPDNIRYSVELLWTLGIRQKQYESKKRKQQMESIHKNIVELGQGNFFPHMRERLLDMRDFAQLEEIFQRLTLLRDSNNCYLYLAQVLIAQKQFERAIRYLKYHIRQWNLGSINSIPPAVPEELWRRALQEAKK